MRCRPRSASSPCCWRGGVRGGQRRVVIFGRLQPIVATIATGAIYFGIALWINPQPGGGDNFNSDFADLFDRQTAGRHSRKPRRRSPRSRSSSGSPSAVGDRPHRLRRRLVGTRGLYVGRAGDGGEIPRLYARGLAGRRSAGLFLTFLTQSGEASAANGGTYTLYSIAAVVLGGVSLFGGSGSAIGAIFGALAFRAIGDLLFVFDIEPLWQPLFQGMVLLASVSIGATRLIGVRNRLDLFG